MEMKRQITPIIIVKKRGWETLKKKKGIYSFKLISPTWDKADWIKR